MWTLLFALVALGSSACFQEQDGVAIFDTTTLTAAEMPTGWQKATVDGVPHIRWTGAAQNGSPNQNAIIVMRIDCLLCSSSLFPNLSIL